jgi:TATA-box binding protein (TBP) (component of TFIID and TFIIIB)
LMPHKATPKLSKKKSKKVSGSKSIKKNSTNYQSQILKEDKKNVPNSIMVNNVVVTEINKISIEEYNNAKKFLDDHKIKISTITMNCNLCTLINIDAFAKYVVLEEDGIVSIKFGDRKNPATNRTIVAIKKKQSKRNFFNQVTILIKPTNDPGSKYINIKVFNNGSLHYTGCKDINDFICVTNTLISILKKGIDIKDKNNKRKHIPYVEDIKNMKITDVKIRMINSNFKLDYKVDRKKLALLLRKYHGTRTTDTEIGYVEFKHKPNGGHSCVNIKYIYDENSKPSIFVFQTGSIIITGAKSPHQIISAYHYLHLILNRYLHQIKIIKLNPKLVNTEIELFCLERDKNNKRANILYSEQNDVESSDHEIRSDKPLSEKKKLELRANRPLTSKAKKNNIKIIRLE